MTSALTRGFGRQAAEGGTRYQVTGPAVLEVRQPEPTAILPVHVGLKGGLEVTKGHNKAEQVRSVSRVKQGS